MKNITFSELEKRIHSFIAETVHNANSKGVVLGISGGIDSAVVLKLCVDAIGKQNILGLMLADRKITPKEDLDDAENIATKYGIKFIKFDIDPIFDLLNKFLPINEKALGNTKARIRANILYHYAYTNQYLVAGTGDKSEYYIGYFTKYGDGASDFLPIVDLYKTQVQEFARYLEIPESVIKKKSSPHLWASHIAEDEIGMSYSEIDTILESILEKKMTYEEIERAGISYNKIKRVLSLMENSKHKRDFPPRFII